jgi:tetratricopeptide (TPR) repeat protein/predicted Ser/Thr protein kinase
MDEDTRDLSPEEDASAEATDDSLQMTTFGRFADLQLLGKGGMGVVYRAHDPVLGRAVALKFIRGHDPEMARRLLAEARAQARIEHPNVCKVYEAGEAETDRGVKVGFIAMQLINGKPLGEAAPGLRVEQKVEVIRQVAEALHAAHRVGIIHRDVKPGNILLERSEDGTCTPYITDFGLARENAAPALTSTGMIVGSPWYMSPEQARGDRDFVDRRTDVYSLGTTLYELLSGRLPFTGESGIAVLMRLISEDPIPLARLNPAIPRDLDTIVMKCLEKDPGRRYESARALAEELRRYLEGEPIQARPGTFFYRMSKRIRRHRALVSTIAVALVLVLIFAFLGLQARWNAGRQAAIAQEFGQQIQEMEAIMRYSYMLPVHDIRREKVIVQQKMTDIRERMKLLGRLAEGPGLYALGQGHMALGDPALARDSLQRAWDGGYRQPEVSDALGQTFAALYQSALDQARRLADPEEREARLEQIRRDYRQPALGYLKRAGRSTGMRTAPAYTEGLIALLDEDYDRALKRAGEALAQVPWLFEALKLQAEVHRMHAWKLADSGDYRSALAMLQKASEAYETAIRMAASNPGLYEGQCAVILRSNLINFQIGSFNEADFHRAIATCDLAIKIAPEDAGAYVSKSMAFCSYGENEYDHGRDPMPSYETAIQLGLQAIRRDDHYLNAYLSVADAYRNIGDYQMRHGDDPSGSINSSLDMLKRASRVQPNDSGLYNVIGNTNNAMALFTLSLDRDPEPWVRAAIAAFQKAIDLGNLWVAHSNLGLSYQYQAEYATRHGRDPIPFFDRAIETQEAGLARHRDHPLLQNNLGYVLRQKAIFELQQGLDPRKDVERSIAALQYAVRLAPEEALAHGNLAIVYNTKAAWEADNGIDPSGSLDRARAELATTIRLNRYLYGHPDYPLACIADLTAARWALGNGKDPGPFLERMREMLRTSVRMNPQNPATYLTLAETESVAFEWQTANGHSGRTEMERALGDVEQAFAISPGMPEALAIQGKLLLLKSRSVSRTGPNLSRAVELLQQALAANPNLQYRYGAVLKNAQHK